MKNDKEDIEMINNFEYYSPTRVVFGKETEQQVGKLIKEYGGGRVLIVYGSNSAIRSGLLEKVKKFYYRRISISLNWVVLFQIHILRKYMKVFSLAKVKFEQL